MQYEYDELDLSFSLLYSLCQILPQPYQSIVAVGAEGNQAEATIRTRGGTDPRDETDHYRRFDAYNRKA